MTLKRIIWEAELCSDNGGDIWNDRIYIHGKDLLVFFPHIVYIVYMFFLIVNGKLNIVL